jgi:hypothetical protein
MFERPPFCPCPKCGDPKGIGFLSGGDRGYLLRCRVCRHTIRGVLPAVNKAVIYLDQFAFSELFKLEAGLRRDDAPHHAFWTQLQRQMRSVLLLQQAIFPSSDIHSNETLVGRHAGALKAAYDRLGGDVRLVDTQDVESAQVWECLQAYREQREPVFNLGPEVVVRRGLTGWLPDMRIVVKTDYAQFANSIREEVNRTAGEMVDLVDNWRVAKSTFDQVLQHELESYGTARRSALDSAMVQFAEGLNSSDPMAGINSALHPVMREFSHMRRSFEQDGMNEAEAFAAVIRFWDWPGNRRQPFHRTSCYLFAALARKIIAGQRKPPTRGFMNDVRAIAAYAPNVDAMFLDRECAALLSEAPLRTELELRARIFSLSNADEFLGYLAELESHAGPDIRHHAQLIYRFE